MTLQQFAARAAKLAAVAILTGAALGAIVVGVAAWHYTRPRTGGLS